MSMGCPLLKPPFGVPPWPWKPHETSLRGMHTIGASAPKACAWQRLPRLGKFNGMIHKDPQGDIEMGISVGYQWDISGIWFFNILLYSFQTYAIWLFCSMIEMDSNGTMIFPLRCCQGCASPAAWIFDRWGLGLGRCGGTMKPQTVLFSSNATRYPIHFCAKAWFACWKLGWMIWMFNFSGSGWNDGNNFFFFPSLRSYAGIVFCLSSWRLALKNV